MRIASVAQHGGRKRMVYKLLADVEKSMFAHDEVHLARQTIGKCIYEYVSGVR